MTGAPGAPPPTALRLDRLLVYLRFAKTRSAANALIAAHAVRRNRQPVRRANEPVRVGDVLTIALAAGVRVCEITALPARRGSPAEAQSHYREIDLALSGITNLDSGNLDPIEQKALAAPLPERG
ncbi:S4 domain-containing protein [Erythrobacter sp. T5W1-R]|uniref:S4 domain-containing protein n=1 Tax=Erythrobacter sp. T5W1-R TaxID=3101752 RepID=UPI002AFFB8EA|nr:S4 domain-containing protein [Erythrobacter sp. T5W1-R]MEA1618744.1 S4 domain-containing protein [Erythrobacter sp. T5W1-R]